MALPVTDMQKLVGGQVSMDVKLSGGVLTFETIFRNLLNIWRSC